MTERCHETTGPAREISSVTVSYGYGYPICVEVFPGNTQDAGTVAAKVSDLSAIYGITNLVFVGDRGMLAPLLDEQRRQLDGKTMAPAGRRWPLQNIIETLKARRSETVTLAGVSFAHITDPTADQARLLELLASPPKAGSGPVQAP